MKPPVVITQGSNNSGQGKIFQVDQDEEEEVLISADLDRIFLGGVRDHTNVIIDTGSAYNLIGHHLVPVLKERFAKANIELKIQETKKKFQFGGRAIISSTGKTEVPIILGRTMINAKIYIVET